MERHKDMGRHDEAIPKWDKKIQPVSGPNRLDFGPTQVRSPEELRVGMSVIYHMYALSWRKEKFEITSLPYSVRERWRVRAISEHARALSPEKPIESELPLADCGVVPYTDETWHLHNWLEKVENS